MGPRLSEFHDEMTRRAKRHVRDAKTRLFLSNRSGWGVVTQRLLLRLMDVARWPYEKVGRRLNAPAAFQD